MTSETYHPVGFPYCHIPSGRQVFIAQRFEGRFYQVHANYCGDRAFVCDHDDLRMWSHDDDKFAQQVRLFAEPDMTFNSIVAAVVFALENNGELLTEFKTI